MRTVNQCSACRLDFTGVRDFDSHRLGRFPQTGPSEYRDRLWRGLVPDDQDWKPEFGRRCLDTDELEQAGWFLDRNGRWSHPRRFQKPSRVSQEATGATGR